MRIELTLNVKLLHELDSNEMARPKCYSPLNISIRDNRDIANLVSSNECRLVCVLYTWLKTALEDSARVGLSKYVCQNAITRFRLIFQ